jgi:hypothetical protein
MLLRCIIIRMPSSIYAFGASAMHTSQTNNVAILLTEICRVENSEQRRILSEEKERQYTNLSCRCFLTKCLPQENSQRTLLMIIVAVFRYKIRHITVQKTLYLHPIICIKCIALGARQTFILKVTCKISSGNSGKMTKITNKIISSKISLQTPKGIRCLTISKLLISSSLKGIGRRLREPQFIVSLKRKPSCKFDKMMQRFREDFL